MTAAAEGTSAPTWVNRDRAEAVIDLDAITVNVARLRQHTGGRDLMAVVKADGYGHGIVESARAARAGGASWLGVAFLDEALRLRASGDTGKVLSWLAVPGERYADAVSSDIEVTAYSLAELDEIVAAARQVGRRAAVQLKLDSGLGRGGAQSDDWPALVEAAVRAQASGAVEVTGVWSHLACSDQPGHPSIAEQRAQFEVGVYHAVSGGLEPRHLHLANSGGALASPATWFTMTRPGIAIYGVSPFPDGSSPVPLTAAMTLRSRLALVKRVPSGQGVSYGHTYVTSEATTLALVPLGYGDGVPRHASGKGSVMLGGARYVVAGNVCMDQFVIDLGDGGAAVGEEVVLFGPGDAGEPTAQDWAEAGGTICYEVVTRLGGRLARTYTGGAR